MDVFEVYRDSAGEWRWRRKAANGEVIADSGEGYSSYAGVERAISRQEVEGAEVHVLSSADPPDEAA